MEGENTRKKFLTSRTEPDIIATVPHEGRAPCKLNNEKKDRTRNSLRELEGEQRKQNLKSVTDVRDVK